MKNKLLFLLLLFSPCAYSQVIFSLKVTSTQAYNAAFVVGHEYEFTFVTNSGYAASDFASGGYPGTTVWQQVKEYGSSEKPLWALVGGDGVSGSYSGTLGTSYIDTQSFDRYNYSSTIHEHIDNELSVMSFPVGYSVGALPVWQIFFSAYLSDVHFDQPAVFTDPSSYFAESYLGTHDVSPSSGALEFPSELTLGLLEDGWQRDNKFLITQITIGQGSAIPEPAEVSLLTGILVVGAAFVAKRKKG